MHAGPSTVSNRRANADGNDAEGLERENDRELELLASKAAHLRQITTGMRDDVESQNLLLNTTDEHMGVAQTGLLGVAGKFKRVFESHGGTKKNAVLVLSITAVLLLVLWLISRG